LVDVWRKFATSASNVLILRKNKNSRLRAGPSRWGAQCKT